MSNPKHEQSIDSCADHLRISYTKFVRGVSFVHRTFLSVRVNEANVVATDIEASNDIIHVIDRVILPEM